MFSTSARPSATFAPPASSPRGQGTATIEQDEQSFTLSFDVPGVSREQLVVGIEGNVVRLHSVEGAPRQVQRAWELAADIDAVHSSAKLENGVLTLTLAKVEPASKATALTIQ